MKSCCAFTLIEIMLAVCIGLLVVTIAVPSITGVFAEQQLHQSYDQFIDLAQTAQTRAMDEHQAYVIKWDDQTLTLEPAAAISEVEATQGGSVAGTPTPTPTPTSSPTGITSISIQSGELYDVTFPAALESVDQKQWTFWPTGTCEPASITYKGAHGTWQADFDALTCAPTMKKDLPQ
ncbi:MAG: hypothetical protein QM796_11960 [Chthoniobacteraceae bacterium]